MTVAIVVQVVVLCIGVPLGAAAGWFGGRTDNLLMRFTDVIYAFPDLLFIILLSVAFRETAFGKAMDGLLLVFVAIGLTSWVTVARLVRGQMLALKETEFVEAAQGDRRLRPQDRHPPPAAQRHRTDHRRGHARHPGAPSSPRRRWPTSAIGVQAPRASWGSLVADGQKLIRSAPHLVLFPAICIAIALISFTFLGDGLRDALDPKLKGKQ